MVIDNVYHEFGGQCDVNCAGNDGQAVRTFDPGANEWISVGTLPLKISKATGVMYNQ